MAAPKSAESQASDLWGKTGRVQTPAQPDSFLRERCTYHPEAAPSRPHLSVIGLSLAMPLARFSRPGTSSKKPGHWLQCVMLTHRTLRTVFSHAKRRLFRLSMHLYDQPLCLT